MWSIACCIDSKIMPELIVNESSKNMLAHVLLSLLVQIRFGILEFVTRYLFYQILHDIFSLQTQFFYWWETIRNECWIIKLKYFMKVFHVSRNDPETVFHETFWKKHFTVYPSLYVFAMQRNSITELRSSRPTLLETHVDIGVLL